MVPHADPSDEIFHVHYYPRSHRPVSVLGLQELKEDGAILTYLAGGPFLLACCVYRLDVGEKSNN